MENYNELILVTWDFTEKSEYALEHALRLSSILKYDIGFVHIVKKESEIEATTKKILDVVSPKFQDLSIKPQVFIRAGSIFSTIEEMVNEIKAKFVIMGTHGIRGMQKLLGSWALKVIAGSRSPFIVVQDLPGENTFRNIVIPVTYRKENKESVNWINYLSKRFGTFFHIFHAKNSDPIFIKGVESNLLFLRKFFDSKGIRFEIKSASGEQDFSKEVISYTKEINADAILLITTRDIGFADYVLGAQEQFIIANSEKIPVVCINPRPAKIGGGFRAGGG